MGNYGLWILICRDEWRSFMPSLYWISPKWRPNGRRRRFFQRYELAYFEPAPPYGLDLGSGLIMLSASSQWSFRPNSAWGGLEVGRCTPLYSEHRGLILVPGLYSGIIWECNTWYWLTHVRLQYFHMKLYAKCCTQSCANQRPSFAL